MQTVDAASHDLRAQMLSDADRALTQLPFTKMPPGAVVTVLQWPMRTFILAPD